MNCLSEYTVSELEEILTKYNEPSYRAKQIFNAVSFGKEIDEITNISKPLKEKLKIDYTSFGAVIEEKLVSKDGTIKYLFKLQDNNVVEGVLMSYKYGNTICVSTQVGCRMNCAFCASGIGGLKRNMTAGEIASEVIVVNKDISKGKERGISNIVLMGTGEPLDNYDNVIKFLKLINSPDGLNISSRNISLSTSGLVPKIYDLSKINMDINLTISLHSPFDEVREKIMPVDKKYRINDLIAAAKNYFDVTHRRVIFEYCMIDGVNDRDIDALELSKLLRGFPNHVNLIRLNYVKEKGLKGSNIETINKFMDILEKENISHTLRRTMGNDINGACGQLRKKYIEEKQRETDSEE